MRDALPDDLDVADGRVVDPVEVVRGADARGGGHRLEGGVVEGHGTVAEPLGVEVLACWLMDSWVGSTEGIGYCQLLDIVTILLSCDKYRILGLFSNLDLIF